MRAGGFFTKRGIKVSIVRDKMLEFIRIYRKKEGHAPSMAEIARAMGVKAPTIWEHFHKRYSADFCALDDYYKRYLKK